MESKKEVRIEIGNRLRELRMNCGKTQDDFAELLGVTQGHYRKVEAGTYELKLEHIITLYHVCNIDPSYLLLGKEMSFDVVSALINCKSKESAKRMVEVLECVASLIPVVKETNE